jgi:hypothetical protein
MMIVFIHILIYAYHHFFQISIVELYQTSVEVLLTDPQGFGYDGEGKGCES